MGLKMNIEDKTCGIGAFGMGIDLQSGKRVRSEWAR